MCDLGRPRGRPISRSRKIHKVVMMCRCLLTNKKVSILASALFDLKWRFLPPTLNENDKNIG